MSQDRPNVQWNSLAAAYPNAPHAVCAFETDVKPETWVRLRRGADRSAISLDKLISQMLTKTAFTASGLEGSLKEALLIVLDEMSTLDFRKYAAAKLGMM